MDKNEWPKWINEKLEGNISYQILQEKFEIHRMITFLIEFKNNNSFKYEFKEKMVSYINTLRKLISYLSFNVEIENVYQLLEKASRLTTDTELKQQDQTVEIFINLLQRMEIYTTDSLWESLKDDIKDLKNTDKKIKDDINKRLIKILNGKNNENLN